MTKCNSTIKLILYPATIKGMTVLSQRIRKGIKIVSFMALMLKENLCNIS